MGLGRGWTDPGLQSALRAACWCLNGFAKFKRPQDHSQIEFKLDKPPSLCHNKSSERNNLLAPGTSGARRGNPVSTARYDEGVADSARSPLRGPRS